MRRILATLVLLLLLSPRTVTAQCVGPAQEAFREGRWDDARAAAQAQLKDGPDHAGTFYCIGRIAYANGKSGEAVDWFEKAIKVEGNSAIYHLWLGNALGDEAQRANKLRQPFLARRVKSEFERAVALDPSSIDARKGLIGFYSIAPGIMGGSMERAKAEAMEIQKLNAMRGHIEMGQLLEKDKDTVSAEREFTAAIDAAPDSTFGYSSLAQFYRRHKRYADAIAVYERLLSAKPDWVQARLNIGYNLVLWGEDIDRAEREVKQWLDQPPKNAPVPNVSFAHYVLGMAYERQAKKDSARAEYQTALAINPRNGDAKKALDALK